VRAYQHALIVAESFVSRKQSLTSGQPVPELPVTDVEKEIRGSLQLDADRDRLAIELDVPRAAIDLVLFRTPAEMRSSAPRSTVDAG
jgi:hypothetical protein